MTVRRRSDPHTFEGNISAQKELLEAEAKLLPHGPEKEKLLRKISQLNTAAHINDWLSSPELRRPI